MTKTNKQRWITAASVLITVCGAISTLAGGGGSGPRRGEWILSGHQDCAAGLVCVDWLQDGDIVSSSCCVDPSIVGSSNLGACANSFRHDH